MRNALISGLLGTVFAIFSVVYAWPSAPAPEPAPFSTTWTQIGAKRWMIEVYNMPLGSSRTLPDLTAGPSSTNTLVAASVSGISSEGSVIRWEQTSAGSYTSNGIDPVPTTLSITGQLDLPNEATWSLQQFSASGSFSTYVYPTLAAYDGTTDYGGASGYAGKIANVTTTDTPLPAIVTAIAKDASIIRLSFNSSTSPGPLYSGHPYQGATFVDNSSGTWSGTVTVWWN